jgi:hypothetical protein
VEAAGPGVEPGNPWRGQQFIKLRRNRTGLPRRFLCFCICVFSKSKSISLTVIKASAKNQPPISFRLSYWPFKPLHEFRVGFSIQFPLVASGSVEENTLSESGLMWIEEYLPKLLDEVVNQKEAVNGIKRQESRYVS